MKPNYTLGRSQVNLMLGGSGEPDTIVWVYTHPGDAGMGRFAELMQQVIDDADAEQRPLVLRIVPEVAPGRVVDEARLRDKMRSWGFADDTEGTDKKLMIRLPDKSKAPPPEPEATEAPKPVRKKRAKK